MNSVKLLLLLAILLLPVLAAAESAVVVSPVANMYSKPTLDADVVSQAIYSTNVRVVERKEGWAQIQTPDEYKGWVEQSALLAAKPYVTGDAVQVGSLFAHLYREPSVTKHQPLLTVPFETRLEKVRQHDARWLVVRLPDDRAAYLQAGDLMDANKPLTIPQTIDLSKRFLGLPYTWGGTSSFGYDCSGFTQMLCRRRGILTPRDADDQAFWSGMDKVENKDVAAGDLLYFGSSLQKITHTGMYIGGGQFIHATTNERPVIQISEFADPHWTRILVAIRRPKQP